METGSRKRKLIALTEDEEMVVEGEGMDNRGLEEGKSMKLPSPVNQCYIHVFQSQG